MKKIAFLFLMCVCFCLFWGKTDVYADNLDEIKNYEITVEPNKDATLDLNYHIEWKVLDSETDGPLTWVKIGLPNGHYEDLAAQSDNIDKIKEDKDNGYYADIYFKDEYEEGDVVKFDFSFTQDYLYQIDGAKDGYTQYTFTPGWFDEIAVDNLEIRWKNADVDSFDPDCEMEDGYNVWTTSLKEGEKFTVKVSYPDDAFAFSEEVSKGYSKANDIAAGDSKDDSSKHKSGGFQFALIAMMIAFFGICIIVGVRILKRLSNKAYEATANFNTDHVSGEKKITRTKVTYYENCPNCGGAREEGKDVCAYCGTNMIESEEILSEEELKGEEKEEVMKHTDDGLYSYMMIPNVFIRVHTVPAASFRAASNHKSHTGSSSHGSCACACAACACACACAGGGRAGCSSKDFYSVKVGRLQKKK